jgi:hypothetical protein
MKENGRRRNERIKAVPAGYSVENFGEVQRFAAKMRRSSQSRPPPTAHPGNSHHPVPHARRIAATRLKSNRQLKVMPTQCRRCETAPQK